MLLLDALVSRVIFYARFYRSALIHTRRDPEVSLCNHNGTLNSAVDVLMSALGPIDANPDAILNR